VEITGLYASNYIAAGITGCVVGAIVLLIAIAVHRGDAATYVLPCWCPAPETQTGLPHVCAHGNVYRYSVSEDRKGAITGTWHLQTPAPKR